MSSQGPNSPGTMSDNADIGTVSWVNPDNAKISDNIYSTVTLSNQKSHYLLATNFGFTIPSGSTIDGILTEVEAKTSSGLVQMQRIIRKGTSLIFLAGSIWLDTTEQYYPSGNASDLWGTSWTAENINDSNFGTVYNSSGTPTDTISIDHIRITVYYTEASAQGVGGFL